MSGTHATSTTHHERKEARTMKRCGILQSLLVVAVALGFAACESTQGPLGPTDLSSAPGGDLVFAKGNGNSDDNGNGKNNGKDNGPKDGGNDDTQTEQITYAAKTIGKNGGFLSITDGWAVGLRIHARWAGIRQAGGTVGRRIARVPRGERNRSRSAPDRARDGPQPRKLAVPQWPVSARLPAYQCPDRAFLTLRALHRVEGRTTKPCLIFTLATGSTGEGGST